MANNEAVDPSSRFETSRTIRLHNELRDFQKSQSPLPYVLELSPIDSNGDLKYWKAKIAGPVETPYENGVFKLHIECGFQYPFRPPKITFQTKVFHPNINSKGNICLDILYDEWYPACSLGKILICICSILAAPNTDDFLVPEAAYLYKKKRDEYNIKAREWTQKYAIEDDQTTATDYNELADQMDPMTLPTSPDNSSSDSEGRMTRFIADQSSQAKAFDYGESKEYVPIVAQCFGYSNNDQHQNRTHLDSLDLFIAEEDIPVYIVEIISTIEQQGVIHGKQQEAERLREELCRWLELTPDIMVQGSLSIYTKDTFFYHDLQEFLREQDESKIERYQSYVRLLYLCFRSQSTQEIHGIEVYRGGNLTEQMIPSYKLAQKNGTTFRWISFTSTTRNSLFAKTFNTNTLFIIQLKKIYSHEKKAIDISLYSDVLNEQEILLKPGVEFTVEKVIENEEEKKYYIHLNAYV